MDQIGEFLARFALIYLILLSIGLAAAGALLAAALMQLRRINLPPDADFVTAMRATPLPVVLVLDLLDLTLDFLSIPIAWVLLSALGLGPLRLATAVEAFIPGTQAIPTMTLAWFGVRLLGRKPMARVQVSGPRPPIRVVAEASDLMPF